MLSRVVDIPTRGDPSTEPWQTYLRASPNSKVYHVASTQKHNPSFGSPFRVSPFGGRKLTEKRPRYPLPP